MQLNPHQIREMADAIRAEMGGDEDETAFLDTLEGATDAMEFADHIIAAMQDSEAMARAIADQEKALKARRDRIEARADALKFRLLPLLDAIGVTKLERPRATISRRAGSLSVQITDPEALPSQLMRVKTVTEPDKAAIKAQLQDGVEVPGAALVRGADTVSVRVA
jgi:hypothetical protein